MTIVGLRGSSADPDQNALIVHDPGYLPFLERPLHECLLAAYDYDGGGVLTLVAAADRGIRVHALECIRKLDAETSGGFLDEFTPKAADDPHDYRIALVHRDDLIHHLHRSCEFPDSRRRFDRLRGSLETELPSVRFWCIAATGARGDRTIWLFDATRFPPADRIAPWSAVIRAAPSSPSGFITLPGTAEEGSTTRSYFSSEPPQ